MSTSAESFGVDLDEAWLLPDPPSPLTATTLTRSPSPSPSTVSLDVITPSTSTEPTMEPLILSGFHFTTNNEDVDPIEFHRTAAQLLSGESSKRDSAIEGTVLNRNRPRQLHCDLGTDLSGRSCCSCGKSYSTSFKLREHVANCAGTLRHFWNYEVTPSLESQRRIHEGSFEDNDIKVADETTSLTKHLLQYPPSQPREKACDLCGEVFYTNSDALVHNMGEHSLDFVEKRYKCDECQIYFTNKKDRDHHLQSADLHQHCGFPFRHNTRSCRGHHPPTYNRSTVRNDHYLMQKHVLARDLDQLRMHRVTVACLMAGYLTSPTWRRMSVEDSKQIPHSVQLHVSVASGERTIPASGWVNDGEDIGELELDAHFNLSVSAAHFTEDAPALERFKQTNEALSSRPCSAVVSETNNNGDSTQQLVRKKNFKDLAKRKTIDSARSVHRRTCSGPIAYLKRQTVGGGVRPWSLQLYHALKLPA